MARVLLQAENLYCERDERVLFDGLELVLDEGQLLQLEGRNGSGKTTLLRILCGLSSNYEGDIYWRGESLSKARDDMRQSLLYFGHLAGVKASLSVEENLRWFCQLCPSFSSDKISLALEKVGLADYYDAYCHSLSAGQQRRVSLARLYLEHSPEGRLWVLDEPFTAIDKQGVAELEAHIRRQVEMGGSVIFTTHQPLASEAGLAKLNLDSLEAA